MCYSAVSELLVVRGLLSVEKPYTPLKSNSFCHGQRTTNDGQSKKKAPLMGGAF
jgi:hypothetical protein